MKRNKKSCRCFAVMLTLTIMCMAIPAGATDDPITVFVNGEQVVFDVDPVAVSGRTMTPIRAIFEAMDATVEWDGDTQTATAVRDGLLVTLQLGSPIMTIADERIEMDVEPMVIDGRILVPARYVGEAFAAEVDWDGDTRTVTICTKDYIESLE